MNIQNKIARALLSSTAERFVANLNRQELHFRKCLSIAFRERGKMLKLLMVSNNNQSEYLRDAINDDVLSQYQTRPTLVFSTDVALTNQQKSVLRTLNGWSVYSMVYNLEDQCGAVLIKNHCEGLPVKNSTVQVHKWGMVYPDGRVKSSTRMPIAVCGSWGAHRRLKKLPKEAPKSALHHADINRNVSNGIKAGKFSINC